MEINTLYIDRGLDFGFFKRKKRIFIIHGHDETNVERLQNMLYHFEVIPITMKEFETVGSLTIIEKFEKLSNKCKYAMAICTPDDLVFKQGTELFQPRPNVIYEIGWFSAKLGRHKIMLLVKEGTNIFSDFQGIAQVEFKDNIRDVYHKIHTALKNEGIA